jgi:hypothetical protein
MELGHSKTIIFEEVAVLLIFFFRCPIRKVERMFNTIFRENFYKKWIFRQKTDARL